MFDNSISHYLRNDNLLLIRQKQNTAILGHMRSEKYADFIKGHSKHLLKSVLLLPEIGQLTMYLQEVPPLAWDIVEFAEKSLEVIYPSPRNLPEHFLSSEGIPIRVYSEGLFHRLLFNQKHPLFLTFLGKDFPADEFLKQHEKILNLPDNFEWKLVADKVMSLGMNGEIKFY